MLITENLFAQLPLDFNEFNIKNNENGRINGLGYKLSTVIAYDKKYEIKERRYSNITYQEYKYDGISYFVSSYSENKNEANILMIEITSNKYSTYRDITIGCNKELVIEKYGIPDGIRKNKFCYINNEYDHIELNFTFDENNEIIFIELVVGT
jgi:hypothetical protein